VNAPKYIHIYMLLYAYRKILLISHLKIIVILVLGTGIKELRP
jgi:hypothetical protein